MKSSGSVSMVTKSGTNQYHGDLFEFVRNGKFNARNSFAAKRDSIKQARKKDDALSLRALEAGIEGGANFIDTGAGYGAGHVEELIGTFLRTTPRKREEIM